MSRRKAKRPSDDISGLLERDALKVHLDEALKSRNLAYCQKGVFPVTDDEWFSVIAVDKEKGLVYVIAVQ